MTPLRRHLIAPLVLLAMAAGVAGCNKGPASPGASATTAPNSSPTATGPSTTSAAPTTSAPQLVQFTTDGAGPYQLGNTLTQLQQGQPGLADVGPMEGCPNNTAARGVGVWGDVQLFFHPDGKLYLLLNRSLSIPTPSGAYLGTTLQDKGSQKGLRSIYAGLVTAELAAGDTKGFLVQTLAGGGILFELNENDEVIGMYAARANFLRSTFPTGSPLC